MNDSIFQERSPQEITFRDKERFAETAKFKQLAEEFYFAIFLLDEGFSVKGLAEEGERFDRAFRNFLGE